MALLPDRRFSPLILAGLLLLSVGTSPAAEILRYTDTEGVVHYVDSMVRIPAAYRDQVEAMLTDSPSAPVSTTARSEPTPSTNQAELQQGEVMTRVNIIGNRVLVPVTVGYGERSVQLTLLLDTGASSTLLDRDVARRLGVRNTQVVNGRVADGRTVQAERGTLDFLQVGSLQIRGLDAAFMDRRGRDQEHDGLLGMNFLRHFQYRIDFPGQVIHWTSP